MNVPKSASASSRAVAPGSEKAPSAAPSSPAGSDGSVNVPKSALAPTSCSCTFNLSMVPRGSDIAGSSGSVKAPKSSDPPARTLCSSDFPSLELPCLTLSGIGAGLGVASRDKMLSMKGSSLPGRCEESCGAGVEVPSVKLKKSSSRCSPCGALVVGDASALPRKPRSKTSPA